MENNESGIFCPNTKFRVYSAVKRVLDILFSFLLIIILFIPSLIIGIAIKINSRGPVIFKQKRIGRNSKEFLCYKFRTMYVDAPKSCATKNLQDAEKLITKVGKILRKTSLDELPQLINIFVGDMSFIGPRPLIPEEKYMHEERSNKGIYNLRPGISGLAQINGRDKTSDEEKVYFDNEYLKSFGFCTDVKIFISTIIHVLKKDNIVEGTQTETE